MRSVDDGFYERTLLFLLVLGLPFQWSTGTPIGGIKMSVGDVVVVLVFILLAAGWFHEIRVPRMVVPVIGFVAVVVTSFVIVPLSMGFPAGFDYLLAFLEMAKFLAGAAWMVVVLVLVSRQPRRHMWAFSVASVGVASLIAMESVGSAILAGNVSRSSGTFGNANLYANYLVLNLFLGIYVVQTARRTAKAHVAKVVLLVSIPILAFALVTTASRSSFAGFVLALPLVLPWNRLPTVQFRDIGRLTAGGGILVGALLVALASNTQLIQRTFLAIDLLAQGQIVGSARRHLWPVAIEAVREHPLLGLGPGQFYLYAPSDFAFKDIHNAYLRVAAELGLVGLVAFLWLLVVALRDGIRASVAYDSAAARALVAFVVATMLWGVFANAENLRTLWIGIGLLAAVMGSEDGGAPVA